MSDRPAKEFVKGAPQPCPPHRVLPRNSKETLREFMTYGETRMHLLSILKDMGKRNSGPWGEYFAFYQANLSGDMATMKPEVKKLAEKIKKAAEAEYVRRMTGEPEVNEKEKK